MKNKKPESAPKPFKAGEEYELLVEKIYRELEPNAEIKQNDFLEGHNSKTKRQIDLSIKSQVAGTKILIIIQAKDYSKKSDIKDISVFAEVIKDVKANKGILICNKGFTKAAINLAKFHGIELLSAHSAINKRWSLELKIPVLSYNYTFRCSISTKIDIRDLAEKTLNVPAGGFDYTINDGITFNKIIGLFEEYHGNKNPNFSGKEITVDFRDKDVQALVNNELRKVDELIIKYRFTNQKLKVNYYTPEDYQILKESITGKLRYTSINFDGVVPLLYEDSWVPIKSIADIPKTALEPQFVEMFSYQFQDELMLSFRLKNTY